MRAPWTNKTGLAKAATILACVFGISMGLCGANFILTEPAVNHGNLERALVAIGTVELAVMVLSLAGLMIVAVIWLVRRIPEPDPPLAKYA